MKRKEVLNSYLKLLLFLLPMFAFCACSGSSGIEDVAEEVEENIEDGNSDDHKDDTTDKDRIEGVLYPDELVAQMGKGFDVAWSEFNKYIQDHSEQKVIDIAEAGFTMVRIRVNKPATEDLFSHLDEHINQCLKHGLIPVLAFHGHDAEEGEDMEQAKQVTVDWWRTVAERYKDYSELLVYNLFVELNGNLKKDHQLLNEFYADIIPAIRESNPYRIIIVPPIGLSKPANLQYIQLPDESDPFVMMEWHCYAAGPALEGNKQWTTGTQEERQLVLDHFQSAAEYMEQTGRSTWFGAWMAGNYNKGNEYDIPAQVQFATFFVRELAKIGVPWCVNTDDKYYDYLNLKWYPEGEYGGIPVRDVILDTEKVALYSGEGYQGESLRLSPGEYDQAELQAMDFDNNISSIMVPWGFKVIAYTENGFVGTANEYTRTTRSFSSEMENTISSLKVIDLETYD
ncbi:cellulase family glycosylhydrolase [Marinifilum flexuosum]|uniref:cellulase family glycosylhydrolase n=1 Tax=Marinifilum flexuosum TaxID=1117708 RepID=UPI002492BE81|nr:cellulase family glycosylhydrolase [Marinifilum flexuosum]